MTPTHHPAASAAASAKQSVVASPAGIAEELPGGEGGS